jgi:hypothetical protein
VFAVTIAVAVAVAVALAQVVPKKNSYEEVVRGNSSRWKASMIIRSLRFA